MHASTIQPTSPLRDLPSFRLLDSDHLIRVQQTQRVESQFELEIVSNVSGPETAVKEYVPAAWHPPSSRPARGLGNPASPTPRRALP